MPMPADRPAPLVKQTSYNGARRETSFYNPAFVTPAFTPGLTPSPRSQAARKAFGGRNGSWKVHPPSPAGLPTGQGAGPRPATFRSWVQGGPSRKGPCAIAIAILLGAVLLFVAIGAYVVLVYLAITTQRPKYIVFTSVLAILFLLIACNALSHSANVKPMMVVVAGNGRERTKSEEHDEVLRSYGLEPTKPV